MNRILAMLAAAISLAGFADTNGFTKGAFQWARSGKVGRNDYVITNVAENSIRIPFANVTNGTGSVSVTDLGGYTTSQTDSRIAELAPPAGNYATVSNRAMTALQSYTETDPDFSEWRGEEYVGDMYGIDSDENQYYVDDLAAAATDHEDRITTLEDAGYLDESGVKALIPSKWALGNVTNSAGSAVRASDLPSFSADTASVVTNDVGGAWTVGRATPDTYLPSCAITNTAIRWNSSASRWEVYLEGVNDGTAVDGWYAGYVYDFPSTSPFETVNTDYSSLTVTVGRVNFSSDVGQYVYATRASAARNALGLAYERDLYRLTNSIPGWALQPTPPATGVVYVASAEAGERLKTVGGTTVTASDVGAVARTFGDAWYLPMYAHASDTAPGIIQLGRGLRAYMYDGSNQNKLTYKSFRYVLGPYADGHAETNVAYVSYTDYLNNRYRGIGGVFVNASTNSSEVDLVPLPGARFTVNTSNPQTITFYYYGVSRTYIWDSGALECYASPRVVDVDMFSEYSTERGYAYGQVCMHDNTPYRCIQGYPVGKAWNASNWTPLTDNGGLWDTALQVWWTPVMVNGSLTYQATTNVNQSVSN